MDIIDGTPILDIKPYIPDYDRPITKHELSHETNDDANAPTPDERDIVVFPNSTGCENVLVPDWVSCNNQLSVKFHERVLKQLGSYFPTDENMKAKLMNEVIKILSADPRSVYRKTKCQDRMYYCTVNNLHLTCWFDDEKHFCEVLKVERVFTE